MADMEIRLDDAHLPFRKRGRFSSDEGEKSKDSDDCSFGSKKQKLDAGGENIIRCPCGGEDSVGFMIQCEACNVWQHCTCVGVSKKSIPESYYCEMCKPNPDLDESRINFVQKEVADAVVYLSHLEACSLAYSKGELPDNQPVPYAFVGDYGPQQEMLSAGPDGRLLRIIPRVIIVCRIIEQFGTEATYDQVLTGYKKKFPHRTADWAQETVKMLLSFRDNHFRFALVPPSSYRLETSGVDIEELHKSLTEMRARRTEAELAVAKGDRADKPNPNAPGMQRVNRRLPRSVVEILDRWFDKHYYDPYPNKHEKAVLAERTGLSLEKISAWFEQKRYRLKKNFQEKPAKGKKNSHGQPSTSVLPNLTSNLAPINNTYTPDTVNPGSSVSMRRNDSCDALLALAMVSSGEQSSQEKIRPVIENQATTPTAPANAPLVGGPQLMAEPQRKSSGNLDHGAVRVRNVNIDQIGFGNNRDSYVSLSSLPEAAAGAVGDMHTPRGMVSRGSERDFSSFGVQDESLSVEVRSMGSGKSRRLPQNALEKLESWYEQHYNDPYPTDADKVHLSELTGLGVEQISAWFHNKRYKKRIARHSGGLVEGPTVEDQSPTADKVPAVPNMMSYAPFGVPQIYRPQAQAQQQQQFQNFVYHQPTPAKSVSQYVYNSNKKSSDGEDQQDGPDANRQNSPSQQQRRSNSNSPPGFSTARGTLTISDLLC